MSPPSASRSKPAAPDMTSYVQPAPHSGFDEDALAPSSAPVDRAGSPPLEDWLDLLGGIESHLRQSVAAQPDGSHALELPAGSDRVRASVLECVAALRQLHATLRAELEYRHSLELQVFDSQTRLAQMRSELAGTRDGERRAQHLARHDGLTALPNRSYFREKLDATLACAPPRRQAFAVLYIDLDGFKAINDEHGHAIGDQLLGIVAQRMQRAIRAEDMVSRWGGDEFACLVFGLSSHQQLCRLAAFLFDAVSAPLCIGKLKLTVRPSIGIAKCPDDDMSADGLIHKADAAMYRAKREQTGYAFSAQCSGA